MPPGCIRVHAGCQEFKSPSDTTHCPILLYAGNRGVARFDPGAQLTPSITTRRGRRPAARSGSPPICLPRTWHIPGVDLPRTRRARPCRQRTVQLPGGAGSAVPQPGPGHRPPATPPPAPAGGQLRHQPQPPATFRLTTAGPQLRHTPAAAVSDLDPDHAAGGPDRDRDRLPFRARAAMPDAVPEQLAHQQSGVIPARMPRPEHPGRERPGNPAPAPPARPPSRSPEQPPWPSSHPPSPPPASRKPPGTAAGHTGMHARLGGPRQAGKRRRRGPSVAVRGTADGAHRP